MDANSSVVSPTPIPTEVNLSETIQPPVVPVDEIPTTELVVNLEDVHTTVDGKPSDVETTVVESKTLVDSNATTSTAEKEPNIENVVLPSVLPSEDKVVQESQNKSDESGSSTPKKSSSKSVSSSGSINPDSIPHPEIPEPSKSDTANGGTLPLVIPSTGNLIDSTGNPTILVPLVGSSKETESQGLSTQTTMTVLLSFGVALLLVSLAIFLIRRSRRARSDANAVFTQSVTWETSDHLEKGESTHQRTSNIPRSTEASDSEKWGLTRDDGSSIHSTISSISIELASSSVQESIHVSVPPTLKFPAQIYPVRPHSYYDVPSTAKISPVRPRSFFDDNRFMPVESPFLTPSPDAKEAENQRMRRW